MSASALTLSLGLFILAGLCEIAGGWMVWQWLREFRPWIWGLFGAVVLVLYG
jgi:small multidrug resistance family-3 protein